MLFWDPTFIILLPALLFAIWAQSKVRKAYSVWSGVETSRRIPASEVASGILSSYGLSLRIERVPGQLTDHYDPRSRVLRLSDGVYDSTSVAAAGIAAHECGHAIQHAEAYAPLMLRNSIVPVVSLGSHLAFPLFFIGIFFSIPILMKIGIFLFAGAVAFHIITLPVEFDASRRAIAVLERMQILQPEELDGAREVLNAAAMTYIAAAAMAILNLIRLLMLSRRR